MDVILLEVIYLLTAVVSVSSQSMTTPGDAVADRPFTLECKITRPAGDRNITTWYYSYGQNTSQIYTSRECTPSILLLPESPAGLSGGCQRVNGEEIYTLTIQNVTEDTGRVKWVCQYKGAADEVTLDVKVMVTGVTVTNPPGTVLAGKPTNLTCVTSASKPQACIRAYIRSPGNVRELDSRACNHDSNSVQATARTMRLTARAEENAAELYCNASNSVTDPPVRSQVYTLNVQYPPQSGVRLSGYANNTAVESGQNLTVTCQVGKGNPKPALSWSSECGQTNTVLGNDGSQQISISITVSPSLNRKTCVCKGSQNGTWSRLTEQKSITFNVLFGPDSVQLRADSGQSGTTVTVTENSTVTFTCNTSESSPAAVLSWYNNSKAISTAEISKVNSQPGSNHGYLTTQCYTVRVDRYQDGDVIRCEAQRSGHPRSKRVSSNFTLNLMYGPMFTSCRSSYIFVENGTAELSCTIWAKPEPTVSWSRGVQPSDLSVTNHRYTSVVRFSKIKRNDSGVYTVRANNSVRKGTERTVNVTVYYPPDVSVVLVSGENATEGNPLQLECLVKAVPQNYTYSGWSRTIGDRLVPLTNSSPGKSLSIGNVTFRDQGVYQCGASNGVGGDQGGRLEVKVRGSRSSGKTEQMRPDEVSNSVQSARHYENIPGSRSSGETEQLSPDDVSNGVQSTRQYENLPGIGFLANEQQMRPDDVLNSVQSSRQYENIPGIGFSTNEQNTGVYEKVDLIPNSEEAARVYTELNTARKTSKTAKGQISVDTFANVAFSGDEVVYYNSGYDDRLETAELTR